MLAGREAAMLREHHWLLSAIVNGAVLFWLPTIRRVLRGSGHHRHDHRGPPCRERPPRLDRPGLSGSEPPPEDPYQLSTSPIACCCNRRQARMPLGTGLGDTCRGSRGGDDNRRSEQPPPSRCGAHCRAVVCGKGRRRPYGELGASERRGRGRAPRERTALVCDDAQADASAWRSHRPLLRSSGFLRAESGVRYHPGAKTKAALTKLGQLGWKS